jgi:REP element-mobilizing transposase RayT
MELYYCGINMAKAVTTRRRKRAKAATPLLPFPAAHGGRRAGAGRKPNSDRAGVPHDTRSALAARFPVHVTVKLREHLPPLRRRDAYAALRAAFAAGCDRNGFRLIHYAVLNDHLHFVVEASGRSRLTRGVQGLLIRIARTLNRLWQRTGRVFADRYHDHILRSPREVRNALRYVLGNGKKHAAEGRAVAVPQAIDTFTSAPWFDGFRETIVVRGLEAIVRPVTDAHTWLLTIGWRRHGLLSVTELPA